MKRWFLLFSCWLMLWSGALAADFTIRNVQIGQRNEQFLVSLQIDYQLSETAQEALQNGVPLTLVVQLQVEKVWGSFWEQRPLERQLRRQIRYHALTELYRVVDLQSGEEKNFVTQDAALRALGDLQGLRLVERQALKPGVEYHLRLRTDLDIESLPLPLRPLAYLGKGWKLTSGWSQWPLKQ
jgi:hypothetical protein